MSIRSSCGNRCRGCNRNRSRICARGKNRGGAEHHQCDDDVVADDGDADDVHNHDVGDDVEDNGDHAQQHRENTPAAAGLTWQAV
eukprot:8508883-Pyramimonas_sp.AAC.1